MSIVIQIKHNIQVVICGLALILSLFAGTGFCADNEPVMPIDYYPFLSSSFGEPRPGRFHYGIDYKSGGAIGKEVYAVGDGSIVRVSSSPGGYGKVLYIQLDSGRMAVYGHLSEFQPEIEARMEHLRQQQGTYDVTWWPSAGEVRVSSGQLIGKSGDSGSWGAPHLHFELRDAASNAVNPFNEGYRVTDTIRPYISSVVLIPLDSESAVDGLSVPTWLALDSSSGPVRLYGRIGVAAGLWDRMNNSNNIMGVYEASLTLDDQQVFSKRYDRLSYSFNGRGSLDYLSGDFHDGSGTISALFRHPGNLLDFYEGNGIIDTATNNAGNHTLAIIASDYAGNELIHKIPVVFGKAPVFEYCGIDESGELRIAGAYPDGIIDRVECWRRNSAGNWLISQEYPVGSSRCDFTVPVPTDGTSLRFVLVGQDAVNSSPATVVFDSGVSNPANDQLRLTTRLLYDRITVTINTRNPLSSVPVITVCYGDNGAERSYCTVQSGTSSWIGSIPLQEVGTHDLIITTNAFNRNGEPISTQVRQRAVVFDMFGNGSIHSDDSSVTIYVPPGALYRNVIATLADEPVVRNGELTPLSTGYRLLLGEERLRTTVIANLTVDGDIPEHAAMFYKNGENGNGGWRFLSDTLKGQIFSGEMSAPGAIAVFEDRVAPRVIPALPASKAVLTNARPLIRAAVSDNGSGLAGSDSIQMLLDGSPIYGELDTGRDRVSYQPLTDLAPGTHTIRITVTDQTGNDTSREWSFTIAQ